MGSGRTSVRDSALGGEQRGDQASAEGMAAPLDWEHPICLRWLGAVIAAALVLGIGESHRDNARAQQDSLDPRGIESSALHHRV